MSDDPFVKQGNSKYLRRCTAHTSTKYIMMDVLKEAYVGLIYQHWLSPIEKKKTLASDRKLL